MSTVVQFLTTTRIGEKGQLTVPKDFRDDLGLESGTPFAVLRMGDGLILLPEHTRFERLCRRINSVLTKAGAKPEAVLATLPETRQRLYERRYGAAVRQKPVRSSGRR